VARLGPAALHERYGNLFEMYQRITGDDPMRVPMRIYPAAHYSMGGLWVDYDLMTTIPGLFAIGEANFSDHGANRLGASAMMQCLADGYFIVPYTLAGYLAGATLPALSATGPQAQQALAEARTRIDGLLATPGRRTAAEFHASLGRVLWEGCGLVRTAAGLSRAAKEIAGLRAEYAEDLKVGGDGSELNQELERAGRVADFLELGELMCADALAREESCGCHFRQEHQTESGDSLRDDERFSHVAVFRHAGPGRAPERTIEALHFEHATPSARDYR
jgi:succinate dehydrogenase / fumarate reductase flavoprotein subunit